MRWLRDILARRRHAEAQRLIGTLFEQHGLEVAPEFPDFVDWLEHAPLHESAKTLARVLGDDPEFPRNGPYSNIRAYFDDHLRGQADLEETAGQLAKIWMMEKASHKSIRVRDGF